MSVEMRLLGDVAHALFVGDQVVLDPPSVEQNLAGGHFHQAGDHLHGGGFARSVRPKIAGDLAGAGDEAHAVDGERAGESFGDAAKFQHLPYVAYYFTLVK